MSIPLSKNAIDININVISFNNKGIRVLRKESTRQVNVYQNTDKLGVLLRTLYILFDK